MPKTHEKATGTALDINITWFATVFFPGSSHFLFTFRLLLPHWDPQFPSLQETPASDNKLSNQLHRPCSLQFPIFRTSVRVMHGVLMSSQERVLFVFVPQFNYKNYKKNKGHFFTQTLNFSVKPIETHRETSQSSRRLKQFVL